MLKPEQLDESGRWWRLAGHEIDLQADPDAGQPANVRAAVLAFRDKQTAEDEDVCELLLWQIEEHPPWGGGCSTCKTTGECPDQARAWHVATEWLFFQVKRRFDHIMSPQWQGRLKALEAKSR